MTLSNDAPIQGPSDDLYNLDPFARAVARGIENMQVPEGIVLAINGPWGVGKSSAINLIKHHLSSAIEDGDIIPVAFNPWWFSGPDAITIAFFRELGEAVGRSLSDQVRQSMVKIGGGISAFGAIAGAAANLKIPGLGNLITSATKAIGSSFSKSTVEQEHKSVSKALTDQKHRFLVVIDDIDRLSPDDAITIFRLVKSVGRLPNVIYLLAFDRELAEKAVAERFPSEGAAYLEKIVQGSFDIPPPLLDVLRNHVLVAAQRIMGTPPQAQTTRFMNVFFDAVTPFIRTPRDVVRLENDLQATWPAVKGEVDRADFLAVAAIKLGNHALYNAIRSHPADLCDAASDSWTRRDSSAEKYNALLGLDPENADYGTCRRALMRLFPRLEGIWSNVLYDGNARHEAARQIASRKHFPTYFAYAIGDEVLPAEELHELMQRSDEPNFVQDYFLAKLAHQRRNGSTQAALALEELTMHADEIDREKALPLTKAIFAMADVLDVKSDETQGFGIGTNTYRIHWLINRLVTERFEEAERGAIYEEALSTATLAWRCDFTRRCLSHLEPGTDSDQTKYEPIVSADLAVRFKADAIAELRLASEDGSLIKQRNLAGLLFQWKNWTSVNEVRSWTDKALINDDFVIAMADASINVGWVQGMGTGDMGDRVASPSIRVDLKPFGEILDLPRFEVRALEVSAREDLTDAQRQIIDQFETGPRGSHGD